MLGAGCFHAHYALDVFAQHAMVVEFSVNEVCAFNARNDYVVVNFSYRKLVFSSSIIKKFNSFLHKDSLGGMVFS